MQRAKRKRKINKHEQTVEKVKLPNTDVIEVPEEK